MTLGPRTRTHRRGFSTIELLTTVTIIGILGAISAASYSTVRDNLQDRDARAAVGRVVLAERAWATRHGSWTVDPADLKIGQGLTITTGVSTAANVVSVAVVDGARLGVAVRSTSGTCVAKTAGDPLVSRVERWVDIPDTSPCSGDAAIAADPDVAAAVASDSAPTQVDGLLVTDGQTPGTFALSWQPAGGAPITGYRVLRSVAGAAYEQVATVEGTAYVDTNVIVGVTYTYAIAAYNDFATGPASDPVSRTR